MTPAHSKSSDQPARRWGPGRVAVLAGAVVAVSGLTTGIALAVGHHGARASGRVGIRGSGSTAGSGAGGRAGATTTTTTTPLVALTVRSVSPSAGATGVGEGHDISLTWSVPPAASSPDPTLSPAVAGHWTRAGATWTFHPRAGFIPGTKETVEVPAGATAVEGTRHVGLASAYTSTFTVGTGSVVRLQELLADLRYLPLTFSPRQATAPVASTTTTSAAPTTLPAAAEGPTSTTTATPPSTSPPTTSSSTTSPPATSSSTSSTSTTSTTAPPATSSTSTPPTTSHRAVTTSDVESGIDTEPTVAADVRTTPRPGTFAWTWSDTPASLQSDWTQGQADLVTRGAVMAFEADHDLGVDGVAGPDVWNALVKAVAARQTDPRPYSYIEVTENDPETLTVWQDGNPDVYSSPANTGAAGAATQLGTFPVYLRYADHAMIGTNPDGTKYDDPDIYWIAYFNGGDAIHGYPRASYGYPQSNGCVELPIANASVVWNSGDDWYGTLVDVS